VYQNGEETSKTQMMRNQ